MVTHLRKCVLKQLFSTGESRSKSGSWMGCGQLVKKVNNINVQSYVGHGFYFVKITDRYFKRHTSDTCGRHGGHVSYQLVDSCL